VEIDINPESGAAIQLPQLTGPQRSGERGAALIIVLVMLLLLTILGSTLLSTSTTDLQIAGNYRNNQKAFYNNDYAVEWLKTDAAASEYKNLKQGDLPVTFSHSIPNTGDTFSYTVTNMVCQQAPIGAGEESGTSYGYNLFEIEITASGPNNAKVTTLVGIQDTSVQCYN